MRLIATTLVAWLCCSACSAAGPGQPLLAIEPGKEFSLRPGQAAQSGGGLQVGFDRVSADSRCPRGAQCIWAGDATVHIWLQRNTSARELRQLQVSTGLAKGAGSGAAGAGVRLLRLDPVPVSGSDIEQRDYVATLLVTEGSTGDAEK